MAVVVTYIGSGIINLATGTVAMVATYTYWALKSDYFGFTLPTAPAIAVTIVVAVLVGVLSELLVFRPLRTSSPLAKLVASLGILLILQATMLLWFGSPSKRIPSVFPTNIVKVFGTPFPANRFWMAAVVVLIAVALTALYRRTAVRPGDPGRGRERGVRHARRPVAEPAVDGQHRDGLGVGRCDGHRRGSLAQADSSTLVLFVVPALAAALFAGFDSLGIACLAGFGVGIGQSLMYYVSTLSWFPTDRGNPLPGVQALLTFLLLVLALCAARCTSADRGELVEKRLPRRPDQRLRSPARSSGPPVPCC